MRIFTLLLLICDMVFPIIKVVNRFQLELTLDKKELPKIYHIDSPARIYEGIKKEIIIAQYTFFEVFDESGRLIKKIGDMGHGPGDFFNIIDVVIKNGQYYFHDYPNIISIFDKNFKFIKRIRLGGPGISQYVQSIDVDENSIYCSQNVFTFKTKKMEKIVRYSLEGKVKKWFFNIKFGEKTYALRDLLSGRIKIFNNKIIFSFFSIPKIWIFEKDGCLFNSLEFGKKWWQKINFNKKKNKNREREIGKDRARAELLLSGDRMMKFVRWKKGLIIHILKNPSEDYSQHSFLVMNKDFKIIDKLIKYKNYDFSGAGKYIYFSKEISYSKARNKKVLEVVKCDLKF